MSLATPERRAELIQGWRQLADYLESHPDAPLDTWQPDVVIYASSLPDTGVAKIVKTSPQHVARAMKGGPHKLEKNSHYGRFELKVCFAGDLEYRISYGEGEVCKPKAYETVPKVEVRCSDEERAAELQAELDALNVRVVVGEELRPTEWECPPSLLKAAA